MMEASFLESGGASSFDFEVLDTRESWSAVNGRGSNNLGMFDKKNAGCAGLARGREGLLSIRAIEAMSGLSPTSSWTHTTTQCGCISSFQRRILSTMLGLPHSLVFLCSSFSKSAIVRQEHMYILNQVPKKQKHS